jgi:hypothetical protein
LKEENAKNLHVSTRVKELTEEKNKLSQQLELSIADCAKLMDQVCLVLYSNKISESVNN